MIDLIIEKVKKANDGFRDVFSTKVEKLKEGGANFFILLYQPEITGWAEATSAPVK